MKRRLDFLAALVAVVAVAFLACSEDPLDQVPQSGGPVEDRRGGAPDREAGGPSLQSAPSAPEPAAAGLHISSTTTTTTEPERVVPATAGPPVPMEPTTTTVPPSPAPPTTAASGGVPSWAQGVPGAESVPAILWAIAACEGATHPSVHDPWTEWNHQGSGASGAWQDMRGTWAGYGGYANAASAPPSVQIEFNIGLYERRGTQPWNASSHCWRQG